MWQLHKATNVTGRPINVVFPNRDTSAFENIFSGVVYPWSEELQNKTPLNIMWTPVVNGG